MYHKKLIHRNSSKFLLICLQLTWEVFMLDTLLMSSEAWEDFKREWSVYKKFQKRRYLTANPKATSQDEALHVNGQQLPAANLCRKELHPKCFRCFLIHFCFADTFAIFNIFCTL